MPQRILRIKADAPSASREEIAQILAYYITGGDPVGYLARLAEKQQKVEEDQIRIRER